MKGQFGDIAAACLCSRPDHIFIVFPEKRQGYNIETKWTAYSEDIPGCLKQYP